MKFAIGYYPRIQPKKTRRALHALANFAKRLECVQLAGAFGPPSVLESGSKLHAFQTLRAIHPAGRTRASFRFSSWPEVLLVLAWTITCHLGPAASPSSRPSPKTSAGKPRSKTDLTLQFIDSANTASNS